MRSCGKTGGGRQPIAHRVVAFRPPPSCITSPFSVSGTDGSPSVVPKAPSGRLRAEPAHLSAAALGPSRDPGPGPGAARPPGAAADAGGAQQVALYKGNNALKVKKREGVYLQLHSCPWYTQKSPSAFKYLQQRMVMQEALVQMHISASC